MVSFSRREAANDRDIFHLLGNAGQMLTDLNAGDRRLDRPRRSAVGMSNFQIERVRLSWTTSHPEQNDGLMLAPRFFARNLRRLSQPRQPAGIRHAKRAGERQFDEVATAESSR